MIDADRLEEAIEYRDRLKAIEEFKRGLADWNGAIKCSFGSYKMSLTMNCVRDEFMAALWAEEVMIRDTLEFFGVVMEGV